MIKRGSLIIGTRPTTKSRTKMEQDDYSKPSAMPLKKPPLISDNEANLIACITAEIRIEVDGIDIAKQAKGTSSQLEKRIDLALAVDGKTLIVYVKTIKHPYQYMSLKPLTHLMRIIDQMAHKGLCSLVFKDKTIIMIKEADSELLQIFLRRLKKTIEHVVKERENQRKVQEGGKSKAEIFHAKIKAMESEEELKEASLRLKGNLFSDQEIIKRKQSILGVLFEKRDAAKLLKNKQQAERMQNLRNMTGTVPTKQQPMTAFLKNKSDFSFGVKRGLEIVDDELEPAPPLIGQQEAVNSENLLTRFPSELLHLIISYLSREEKKSIAVCRDVYQVLNLTRHTLIFSRSEIPVLIFQRMLKNSPNLKALHIRFRDGAAFSQNLFQLPSEVFCFHHLQVLDLLEVKRISDTSFLKLVNCCNFAALRSVSLNSTSPLSDSTTNYVAAKLKKLQIFHYGVPGGFRVEASYAYSAHIVPDQIAGMLFRFCATHSSLTSLKIPTVNANIGCTIGKKHTMLESLSCHSVCPKMSLQFLNKLKYLRVLELGSENENLLGEFNILPSEKKLEALEQRRESLVTLLEQVSLLKLRLGGITLLSPGILQTIAFKQGESLEWLGLHSDQLRDDIFEVLLTNLSALKVLDFSGCPAVTGSFFYARDEELGQFKCDDLEKVYHSIPNYLVEQFKMAVWKLYPKSRIMKV